ncbi:DUF5347 family protein [Serratia ureilytica]|uniref:Uncharacterized protein n=1 Tax=Serratia ureilytica TaxID=300181 RepID=A0A9X9BZH5_9GAMM|nr:DUF5347 family protein [Serratia ureilytica]TXE26906.1 hypothetical protein FOT63_18390 [Serratia ureilytica]
MSNNNRRGGNMRHSASTGNLTAEQIARGLSHAAKLKRLVISARTEKNLVREFFDNLRVSRYRAVIYFWARIGAERHRLHFEELTERERIAIINAMLEMRELVNEFPKDILHDDAKLT